MGEYYWYHTGGKKSFFKYQLIGLLNCVIDIAVKIENGIRHTCPALNNVLEVVMLCLLIVPNLV